MVTTCPHCSTSFNVEAEVLLSRNGRVRCGRCKQIFDGLLNLTTLEALRDSAGSSTIEPETSATAVATPVPPVVVWPPLPVAPEVPIPPMPLEIAAAASPVYQSEVSDASALPETRVRPAVSAPSVPSPAAPTGFATARAEAEGEEAYSEWDGPPGKRLHRGWACAAVLAALFLGGQVIYRHRGEIAAHVPAVKPLLVQVCAWAGCGVPPLQHPASLNIEASDLQVVDKAQPHLVQLTATLRNRAGYELGYPAFDLVLTDNREHALARRVILPADYLTGGIAAVPTIAANAEVTVRVDMDIGALPAAGFRLNLAAAPAQ